MALYPNLERLNVLLRNPSLKIPDFRAQVDPSGRNLKWLKKVLPGSTLCPVELKTLLEMPQVELLKALTVH